MEYGLGIKNNHLYFGGADTVELAKQYGTPLYVFDEHFGRQDYSILTGKRLVYKKQEESTSE